MDTLRFSLIWFTSEIATPYESSYYAHSLQKLLLFVKFLTFTHKVLGIRYTC